MLVSEALKFAENKSAFGAALETAGSLIGVSTAEDLGKLSSNLLGASRNLFPKDVGKIVPAAQMVLNGDLTKFLSGDTGGINSALGALRHVLPPELSQLVGKASPFLTKGLESLLKDGGLPDLGNILNADNLMGLAAQFLPPWAGDAMAVGKALASGDIGAALDSVLSKYLPPELKAVYDAIKNLPGGWQQFLADLFNNPKTPQGANGFWAARISDVVVCPGGGGAIDSGLPTVLIGGMPAARVTDTALCNGVPKSDAISLGESTIIFGGHFASRITDQTAHGGKITTGFPTVHLSKSLGQCEVCLTAAAGSGGGAGSAGAGVAGSGAATISGAGINPVGEGILGDVASELGDMAKNKIADFAQQKAGELAEKVFGSKGKENYDGSNFDNPGKQKAVESGKPRQNTETPKPQPKIHDDDDDFAVTKRN